MNFSDSDTRSVTEQAREGILDLRELPEEAKLLALSGEWKFTPNQFVRPDMLHSQAENQMVPRGWDKDAQYGSYQLKMTLPDHFSEVGFRVRIIWSAHTIYVNGEKVSEIGKIGTTKAETVPENPSYEFYLEPKEKEMLVTIHVANFYNARGGIVFPIDFGDATKMREDVEADINIEWTAIFILLIFSIFHLTIFLLRKKDDAFFYSGSYLLGLALVVMTRGERVLLRNVPYIPFDSYFRFQDAITFFSALLLPLFLVKIIPSIMNRKQMVLLFTPLFLYTLAIALVPARALSNLQFVFFYYINILLLGIIIRVIWLIIKKQFVIPKNETVILGFALLFLFLFTFSGTLEQLFLSGHNILNRFGLLGTIIVMNVFLSIRFINRAEEAEKLNIQLEKTNVAKDAFLEVTTKELKHPLYHAINLAKAVRVDGEQKGHYKQLRIIEQLMERLLYLVNDLQDFTRIRFQDYSFDVQPTNMRMIVCHVMRLMDFSFSRKNIQFQEHISHTLHVLADENRLIQVFYRLVEECSDYAVNGKIIASAHHTEKEVRLIVKGTGENGDLSLDQSNEMGLRLGKELIERMNGSLDRKRIENGILFTVILPFSESNQFVLPPKEEGDVWSASTIEMQTRQTVLIVEDNVIHAEVLASLLSERYNVTIVHTSQEALSLLHHVDDFSAIIIDEVMPGMGGIELTKRIRQKASLIELPIIMIISNDYPTNVETIFAAGVNDYIVKPVMKQAILARLNAVEQTKLAMTRAIDNEMAFLQTQIKPHFLYNAMSSIISFCYTDGERAAHLLTMLSSYLRYILEVNKSASLQKELHIIEAYVEIEKARFDERLSFSYEIDSSLHLTQIYIPGLLIQPLVENAIRHGIFEKEGNGHIQLTINRLDDSLFIQIIDNGVGMSTGQVHRLLDGTIEHKGIGFSNVLRRVCEMKNGNVTIHSAEGEGTTVSITIPLKEDTYVAGYDC
jgi:two-component system, sensor histidine kinase ChiS